MCRTFAIDALACPDCGGRLRLVATIAELQVIETILAHLGPADRPTEPRARPLDQWLSDRPD